VAADVAPEAAMANGLSVVEAAAAKVAAVGVDNAPAVAAAVEALSHAALLLRPDLERRAVARCLGPRARAPVPLPSRGLKVRARDFLAPTARGRLVPHRPPDRCGGTAAAVSVAPRSADTRVKAMAAGALRGRVAAAVVANFK